MFLYGAFTTLSIKFNLSSVFSSYSMLQFFGAAETVIYFLRPTIVNVAMDGVSTAVILVSTTVILVSVTNEWVC